MYINEKIVCIITFHLFAREILRSKYSSMRVCVVILQQVFAKLLESHGGKLLGQCQELLEIQASLLLNLLWKNLIA